MRGCLQGIRGAREILSKDFSAHPIVATVLNARMQKKAMMREEHKQIQIEMSKVISALRRHKEGRNESRLPRFRRSQVQEEEDPLRSGGASRACNWSGTGSSGKSNCCGTTKVERSTEVSVFCGSTGYEA